MIATAIPRRRENQCDVSASSGANVAELPNPMSRPWASEYCHSVEADAAAAYPSVRQRMPMTTGGKIPNRSDSRPSMMPPTPKPIIVKAYESDASARETPKSVCTAGSATTTDHMPIPPMAERISVSSSRVHA